MADSVTDVHMCTWNTVQSLCTDTVIQHGVSTYCQHRDNSPE